MRFQAVEWELKKRRAAKLSSGQKQRLSIARALAKPAPILIADEPTGNLDPENSAKVIALLAQAAKTRLVLLVTHEYEEAKDHVTRHIRLQDGRVVMDAAVREPVSTDAHKPAAAAPKKSLSGYVAALQLKSRPVWAAILALFFTLTAFAVFAFLGTFIIALDDTDTRIYDDSAFLNGDRNRIVVTTVGQKPLTQTDYETILNTEFVQSLERNGYVSDVQYSYREGVDHTIVYTGYEAGNPEAPSYMVKTSVNIHKDSPYVQTVPVYSGDETFLKQGALPASFYQVVAHSADGFAIGERITVYFTDRKFWGENNIYLELEFTVVGITDYGSGLYFSDDVGRFCQQIAKAGKDFCVFIPQDTENLQVPEAYAGADLILKDNECIPSSAIVTPKMDKMDSVTLSVPLMFANINLKGTDTDPLLMGNQITLQTQVVQLTDEEGNVTLHPFYPHGHKWITRLVIVSANTFNAMTWNAASEQVSITIEDYAYTDRVLDALNAKGYIAVSPFRLGATQQDEEKAQQREQTLTVCLLALLAVTVLQLVLLRALFAIQTESYQMLRNIGLVSKDAKKSILWQVLVFTLVGQIAGGAGIWICGTSGIQRIANILKYLPISYVAVLCAVHCVISVLSCLWVIRALGKQVYPLAGRYGDLELEEETEAVL